MYKKKIALKIKNAPNSIRDKLGNEMVCHRFLFLLRAYSFIDDNEFASCTRLMREIDNIDYVKLREEAPNLIPLEHKYAHEQSALHFRMFLGLVKNRYGASFCASKKRRRPFNLSGCFTQPINPLK